MDAKKKPERAPSREPPGLTRAALDLLAQVRESKSPEKVFGLPQAEVDAVARSVVEPLVEGAGLTRDRVNNYRWFATEICRLMRTRSGPALAFFMERSLRKWLRYGVEPNTAAFLAAELFERLRPRTSPNDEDRMTIETRSPNGETAKSAKDAKSAKAERDSSEVRDQKPECRNTDTGEETPGAASPNDEDRMTIETRSPNGETAKSAKPEPDGGLPRKHEGHESGEETAKNAKSADCVDVRLEPQNPGTPGPGTAGSVPSIGGGGP